MSPRLSNHSATESLPDNLDLQLFHDVQAYLQGRQGHQVASAAERQAWEWFHVTYNPLLSGWALGCHVPLDDLKDCIQEAWIAVMNNVPDFASDGTQRGLCSWLHAITHAKAVDLLRQQARHSIQRLRPESEDSLVSQAAGPAGDYEQRCREEAVQRILAVLRQRVD